MSAREMLRDTAARLEYAATIPHQDLDVAVEHRTRAAALRALADRWDAEMAKPAMRDYRVTWSSAEVMALLARLDAPPQKEPRHE